LAGLKKEAKGRLESKVFLNLKIPFGFFQGRQQVSGIQYISNWLHNFKI